MSGYVTCGQAATGYAGASTTVAYEKQTNDQGQCTGVAADGTVNEPPLDPTGCCDRPLRPGVCVTSEDTDTETTKAFKCEKRWVYDRIANFRRTCNAKVGDQAYGHAYFLSAKSELQVGKVRYVQTVIDANVICFPAEPLCTASDLQNHLKSRAEECTQNFMSKCTYTARPIECNVPTKASSKCTGTATVDGKHWNDLIKDMDPSTKWGYTTCDNIMKDKSTCVYNHADSRPPVAMSASFAAFLRPAVLTAFAVLTMSMLLIADA
jgi:hypothetical protein